MSLAIFISGTASARSPAEAPTMASRPPWAANLFAAVTNGYPISVAISAAICSPNPGGAFSPVPTAVPPAASSYRPSAEAVTRPIAWASCCAYPDHSWPTVSGTASSRWVRPILTTSAHWVSRGVAGSAARVRAKLVTKFL